MEKKQSPLLQEQLQLLLKTPANTALPAGTGGKGINLLKKKKKKSTNSSLYCCLALFCLYLLV